ncbi:MAG: glycosyltransferase family 2 protein [Elusimicrobiota bacterium]|jgi:glycosyltransferase involved in cell wall biosynthesis|nr:glycosyltransferase family 2 protein [Elusimicrobiota bacterium]
MSNFEKISIVIITKNEEKNIKRCIENILDISDEIIILDSKSTDKTIEIINSFKAEKINLYEIEWQGFGKTKNIGIEMAKNNWILSLDADEVVTEKLKLEIVEVLAENNKTNINGYYIPRRLFFCGREVKYGGTYPDYQLRLFKKNEGRFETIEVHESLILNGKKAYLKNFMKHYSYHSMFEYWERFNIYTELDAKKKFNNHKKFRAYKILVLFFEIFKRLFLKFGIFDGFPGIFYHIFSSISSFVKYAKLWEIDNKKNL